jgi:integrase
LRAAKNERRTRFHLPLFIMLGIYTGCRQEAILSLQWEKNLEGGWVDLSTNMIHWNPPGAPLSKKRRPPKPTRIPRKLRLFLRYARRRTSRYVIEIDGRRVSSVKKGMAAAAQWAGIQRPSPDNVHPHTTRHTCITWLLQAGEPRWNVAGYCGISLEMLEQVYGHHDNEAAAVGIDRAFGRAMIR